MSAQFDVVVFGATSFVGQILSRYLFERHGASGGELTWAMAGRSRSKLERVRGELGPGAADIPLILANADDETALTTLCSQTRVVISTVGPYALYGSELVRICAESGTDYCDLTGEVQWIRRMIDAHEDAAKQSGARIVHCCGFDSVPSDLGLHFFQQQARERFGTSISRVKMRVKAARGGFSGGTVASLLNVVQEAKRDPALRKQLANPHLLCPPELQKGPRQPNVSFAEYDPDARSWLAPFVMAAINTRVVHRSNAIAGFPYGDDFVYDEAMMTGISSKGRLAAISVALGMAGFMTASVIPPTRWLLQRFVVPKPGEGPTPAEQEAGFFDVRFFGHGPGTDELLVTKVTGDRDPGYGSTGKMLGEAGACLALDVPKDAPGGFWTPATLLGDAFMQRLQTHAGLRFEVVEG
ncbi:saccharopine dehydrogenase NADP-binding domain-containing protein [uncultured Abyssibacter sp.]|uniref:saccharopine dehydrogenase family protein n=1 Tax=uncultured Abyssibacter sp. TaxID=2320202 RepID=UPI0032B20D89